jgi:hypothetical protein
MSKRGHGQIRRSQVITTWGPGALIDLPHHAAIVGGLETWPREGNLDEVVEPRLSRRLERMTGVAAPRLYAPPIHTDDPTEKIRGIGAFSFPEYFLVQETALRLDRSGSSEEEGERRNERSRRLVHRKHVHRGRFEGCPVVPIRFVRACARGHVDDLNWFRFVHGDDDPCRRQLWLDERGTSGDLGELVVRCECGKNRRVSDATHLENIPLGLCNGARPWLGPNQYERGCNLPSRLLVRTASSAYFPQSVAALSLPDRRLEVDGVVRELWDDLQIVADAADLTILKRKPKLAEKLAPFGDAEVLAAIQRYVSGGRGAELSVKLAEIGALLAVPEGFGEDVPVDPDFHARRLPDHLWRRSALTQGISSLVQVHRLREVVALIGFTRFEPVAPNIQGEFEANVERAPLQVEPRFFPAVENRGEGIFLQLGSRAVNDWLDRDPVKARLADLAEGHRRWLNRLRVRLQRPFPGGPYVLLHTLSHLLLQSLAMRCGYPASSIRERIYVDAETQRYGILLYTGSPDAEGTLGGLVQQARHLESHLADALQRSELCSNDPICAHHAPRESLEERWLLGAACHGCVLVAETSCEVRNDYLDRALVVPVPGLADAAFFGNIR